MRDLKRQLQKALRNFWRGLRQWSGDCAYETYVCSAKRQESRAVLTPAEFYVEQLNRKYSRPNRCC
jgi:uncharacterized short protein YbdD (DUF466 family)